MQGFLILNCIIGGQALAAVSSRLDDTLGIVIISVLSLVVRILCALSIDSYETFICRSLFVGTRLCTGA